jgi:hypothetical protein
MNSILQTLNRVLAQEDTLIFVGSGISMWSGLPSWEGIIEELVTFLESIGAEADIVRAEAVRGDLLQAASYGFDKLTDHQIGEFIRRASRYGVAQPHEIHRKIVSLGPRSFVTTNYDNLVEEALRQWRPDRFIRTITNRHLTETAEIVHARAIDFVFKPHGDAGDSDSIVLTREQYRKLLPQGERHATLESLKILLVSRPVIYLGFGLRDPDFLYIRDLLANTYKGGTRDHYAFMADVSDYERDYWRRHYGIHLVGYTTSPRADLSKDHTALLTLLDSLLKTPTGDSNLEDPSYYSPAHILSLARHAARLARQPKVDPEFTIRVHSVNLKRKASCFHWRREEFDAWRIEDFLDHGPDRAILMGLPGAGKSYALHQSARRLADALHTVCLTEPFDETAVVVPIIADLKLYRGDLAKLVDQTLPSNLPFQELRKRFKIRLFLDSFNEMPREFRESGAYESDFAEFASGDAHMGLVIGSRTTDGLETLEYPFYCLDEIDRADTDAALVKLGISVTSHLGSEISSLLQKPFFFQLIARGDVDLPVSMHPRDLYRSYFYHLQVAFRTRFACQIEIEEALSQVAYDSVNLGEEVFPISIILKVLKFNLSATQSLEIAATDVVNWLVSRSVLLPYTGARVAFVHQSITEYLAAKELARRYSAVPGILNDKFTLTRWDQALFFTLSLLPPQHAKDFFEDIVRADLPLALSAVKYLEVGQEEAVSRLLDMVPEAISDYGTFESRIEWHLSTSLPITATHEPQLKRLMGLRNMIGGAAAARLIELKGTAVKEEMLDELLSARYDFNYCVNGIAPALVSLITDKDIPKLVLLVDSVSDEVTSDSDDEVGQGLICGVAVLLSQQKLGRVRDEFLPSNSTERVTEARARILCEVLYDNHSTEALNLAGELLLRGVSKAATALYFIAYFARAKQELSWEGFTTEHVDRLVASADGPSDESWALKALKCLCQARLDLAQIVSDMAMERGGIRKACLLYCASSSDSDVVFSALVELTGLNSEQLDSEPIYLISELDLNWTGHEELFVRILKMRHVDLALVVLDQVYEAVECPLGELEIGKVNWWLEWLMDEAPKESSFWFLNRMSWLLVNCMSRVVRQALVEELNKSNSRYRRLIASHILVQDSNLSTDELSDDTISFLLADLSRAPIDTLHGHILGQAATERFVEDHLLPLCRQAKGAQLANLKKVLRQAGLRHGRRYIIE